MQRRIPWVVLGLLSVVALPTFVAWGQTKKPKVVRRAQPPKFEPNKVANVFFDNVFDRVAGERPAAGAVASAGPRPVGPAAGATTTASAAPAGAAGSGWSALISGATIEDEIKRTKGKVDMEVTAPGPFAGKGYKECRVHFTIVAMLFGIAGEYESDVRWKNVAPGARDVFGRTAANCKVGSQQAFNEAKVRKQELESLVGGEPPSFPGGEPKTNWAAICNRGPLMQRLERAFDGTIKPMTANKADFTANAETVKREAELIAAISHVLQQDGMEDGGDAEYRKFAEQMKQAGRAIAAAAEEKDDAKARAASGTIEKMCSGCHENYRA